MAGFRSLCILSALIGLSLGFIVPGPSELSACGGTINTLPAEIEYPGNGTEYDNDEYCEWVVTNPNNGPIQILFEMIGIELCGGPECPCDKVEVYDDTTLIDAVCGYDAGLIPEMASTSPIMRIVFTSDGAKTNIGFIANLTAGYAATTELPQEATTDIDDCINHQCINGICFDLIGGYDCICDPGWTGIYCEQAITTTDFPTEATTDIDDCINHQCMNGICVDLIRGYECICDPGWTGIYCEQAITTTAFPPEATTDMDECVSNPCLRGTCQDLIRGYKCLCDPGWTGDRCETDINECSSDPCLNGVCTDRDDEYICLCNPGWTGDRCETNIDECLSDPCINGVCLDQINGYTCFCEPGWEGVYCETDIDECLSDPCINGSCLDRLNEYHCFCSPGWTGERCETDINECSSDPCFRGICEDWIDEYNCLCNPGWTGDRCETNIDECLSGPCVNGLCEDLIDRFNCDCDPGWTGELCEIRVEATTAAPAPITEGQTTPAAPAPVTEGQTTPAAPAPVTEKQTTPAAPAPVTVEQTTVAAPAPVTVEQTTVAAPTHTTEGPTHPHACGVVYKRWGRTSCPADAELVYNGYTATGHHDDNGGGRNFLCLPDNPEWSHDDEIAHSERGNLYGVQYEGHPNDYFEKNNTANLQNEDVPCAVCYVGTRCSSTMIPGRMSCSEGWTLEYNGLLMSGYYADTDPTTFECVDRAPEIVDEGSTDFNGARMVLVESKCNPLSCSPYVDHREVACVVCTR